MRLIAATACPGERQLHPAAAEAGLTPHTAGAFTPGTHLVRRMLHVPHALPGTRLADGAIAGGAGDLVRGREPGRVPVVDVQVGQAVAPLRYDIRLVGPIHGAKLRDADGGGEAPDEFVVLHGDPRLRQCGEE